jgi:hypothetical protein
MRSRKAVDSERELNRAIKPVANLVFQPILLLDSAVRFDKRAGPDQRFNLASRIELFDVFNRDQLAGPDTNLADPSLAWF